MYCIWVSRDPEEHGEGSRAPSQMLFTSSFNSTLNTSHGGYLYEVRMFNRVAIGFSSTFKNGIEVNVVLGEKNSRKDLNKLAK